MICCAALAFNSNCNAWSANIKNMLIIDVQIFLSAFIVGLSFLDIKFLLETASHLKINSYLSQALTNRLHSKIPNEDVMDSISLQLVHTCNATFSKIIN